LDGRRRWLRDHSRSRLFCGEGRLTDDLLLQFLTEQSFDDKAVKAIGEAYDLAREMLHDRGQPRAVREVIAKRIIKIALTGERNPAALARRALETLGFDTARP
jgi:hypothetical protein